MIYTTFRNGDLYHCFTHIRMIYFDAPKTKHLRNRNMFRFHTGFTSVSHKVCFMFKERARVRTRSQVSLLWWMALSSRCFAPCCCYLDDVECPCAPCKTFHFLDVPFFVGVSMAWIALQGFFLRETVLALSMALLLLAIPSGFVKWRWMKDKAATPSRLDRSGGWE